MQRLGDLDFAAQQSNLIGEVHSQHTKSIVVHGRGFSWHPMKPFSQLDQRKFSIALTIRARR